MNIIEFFENGLDSFLFGIHLIINQIFDYYKQLLSTSVGGHNMSNFISHLCHKCCPWLWHKTNPLSEFQSKQGDNENQSFMKQTFQTPVQIAENIKQKKSFTLPYDTYSQTPTNSHITINQTTNHSNHSSQIEITKKNQNYTQCIEPSHPYNKVIKEKLQSLPTLFDQHSQPQKKVPETPYGLQLFIRQTDDEKSNIFVYHFTFPTTFQLYEEMQNNFELQKKFDSNIDIYQCRDRIDDNTKVIYLAYKKILIVSPRDFIYVRYQFKKDNEYWAVATSIPEQETFQGKIRGDILLTATRAIEKDGKLHLSVYSQIDMKMPVKASAAKSRGVTEIKKYLDKCYSHLESQKENIL